LEEAVYRDRKRPRLDQIVGQKKVSRNRGWEELEIDLDFAIS